MSALTPEEARSVKRTVERELELAKGRYHSQPSPRAILLAGQPGAGKTILSSLLQSSLDNDAVFINGDDYRRYHPHYSELYRQYGSDSVPMTSAFSGKVTENLIACFSDLAFNMVVEGTGRTVDVPKRTATILAEKGYRRNKYPGFCVKPTNMSGNTNNSRLIQQDQSVFSFKEMAHMTLEQLNTALYQKMFAEQEKYKAWLLSQSPEEILNHA